MENPYWHEHYKSHTVDFDEVRDLCFDAYSIMRASAYFMGTSSEEKSGKIDAIFFEKAEVKLTEILLNISVKMRTFEDILATHEVKEEYDNFIKSNFEADQIGSLGNGKNTEERVGLSFREACNKIIHAEDLRYVYSNGDNPRDEDFGWGMEGTIELQGRFGKKHWDAWIFADDFLEACMLISENFDRDGDEKDQNQS